MQATLQGAAPIVEILAIGREILDGRVIDTNSVWMAEKLKERGLIPRYGQRVDDDFDRVIEAFEIAQRRSQIILVTGGLGPTADDLTAEAFGRFTGEKLELHPEAMAQLEAWFKRMNRTLLDVQRKQAYFPKSCRVLENFEGTAPGFARRFDSGQSWYFTPGVPKEMKRMFTEHILPELPRVEGYRSSSWATQFTSEGELQKRLNPVHAILSETEGSAFEITYRTRFPENHIGLHGVCTTPARNTQYLKLAKEIETLLGEDIFSGGIDKENTLLEFQVVQKLKAAGAIVATVESCTGGLVANRITDIPGSSAVYWGSWLTYDYRAKEELGVPKDLMIKHGAVSPEVAKALAEAGLVKLTKLVSGAGLPVDKLLCVSTTGIAGPGGETPKKPVGLCYVALAKANGETLVEEVLGRPQFLRTENKTLFAQRALDLVRRNTDQSTEK
jgi:nicotinamide-nucleotide amidase